MKKFAVKRPNSTNSKIWEWRVNDPVPGNTYVDIIKYDTRDQAEEAAKSWSSTYQIVEIEVSDPV